MIGDLQRFLTAQEGKTIHGNTLYEQALIEIEEGKPDFECWVRYVYPQLKRTGTEAKAYIEHPILRERLIRAFQVLLDSDKSVYEVFSNLGVLKIRTCALLFASITDEPVIKQLIRKYHW